MMALGAGSVTAAVALALLTGFGVVGGEPGGPKVASGDAHVTSGSHVQPDFIQNPVKPGEPCPYAKQWSLTDLAAQADVPIWLPNDKAASVQTLTGAWTCMDGGMPLLAFSSGVQVWYEGGWGDVSDPQKQWEAMVSDTGLGQVETVLDRPALVQPAAKDSPKGEVLVIVDGVLIRVIADASVPTDQLVNVANSINIAKSLGS